MIKNLLKFIKVLIINSFFVNIKGEPYRVDWDKRKEKVKFEFHQYLYIEYDVDNFTNAIHHRSAYYTYQVATSNYYPITKTKW